MHSLEQIIAQIQKEIRVNSEGKGFASIRATARLAGIDFSGLAQTLKTGVELEPSKIAKILIHQGFKGEELASWAQTGIPDVAIAVIVEYYALDAGRYCTETALLCLRAFTRIGIRAWMRDIKGWKQPETKQPELPPADVRVSNFVSALEKVGIDLDNPRWSTGLKDCILNISGLAQPTQNVQPTQVWAGLVEIAEEMGYPQAKSLKVRGNLGKYISAAVDNGLHLQRRQEKRLCNGTNRPIWVYLDCDRVRNLITEYFTLVA